MQDGAKKMIATDEHRSAKDAFQWKNLADDAGSRALLAEMDKRLANLMKETGDSWNYKATTSDYKSWLGGGSKENVRISA